MTGVRVEVVPLRDVGRDLRDEWSRLAQHAVEANPFFEPELLLPAARLLPGGAQVELLLAWRGAELVAATPVRAERHRRVPLPAACTWRHAYRYLGTPLVREDALEDAPAALLAALARRCNWLVLEQVYVDDPVVAALSSAARARGTSSVVHEVWERPAVRARTEETYLEGTLSTRSAKRLRRQRRNLERDLGPVLSEDVAGGDLAAEVDGFLQLEAAGWKGRAATALGSVAADAEFFRQVCDGFARGGRLELWRLRAGPTVAARQCHFISGRTVFHFKTTYDEQLARYSPGVQLELDVLHAFHADPGLDLLDPCTETEDGTSSRLYPDTRRLGEVLIGLTPVGRLAARALPGAALAWRAVHR